MNKSYLLIGYALAVIFVCTGVGYKIGYSAKHNPAHIVIRYNNSVAKNLDTYFKQAEIDVDQEHIEKFGKLLKEGGKHTK